MAKPKLSKPKVAPKVAKAKPKRPATPRAKTRPQPLIDLADNLSVLEYALPVIPTTADGRPVVGWAQIGVVLGRASEPKAWVALLTAPAGRIDRTFVERATSHKAGYEIVCEDPFLKISFYRQEHPLGPGVYEASSTWKTGPVGYTGRAAFDVHPDGRIEIVAVGARDRGFPPDIQRELLRRIAIHDGSDQHAAQARIDHHAEQAAEVSVRGDQLAERHDLPTLSGSERQVRWAMEVRQRTLEFLLRRFPGQEVFWVQRIRAQTAARWWIDNRENAATVLGK